MTHVPLLAHMHDAQDPKRSFAIVSRLVALASTRFVCVSEAVRRVMVGLGIAEQRTEVLYNGVQLSYLGERPDPAPEVSGPGPHILMCAQIVPWKGQHVFLDAASRIARKHPTARFYVVGTLAHPDDQSYMDQLRATADEGELRGRVVFAGYQSNVPSWMIAADVIVHASTAGEAFGLVIAEAMALGKRVVASDTGGPREIVEDGVTGRLVPPNDAGALAVAIEDLASRPPDDPMGARAARSIRERFTPERFGNELASLYARTLGDAAV